MSAANEFISEGIEPATGSADIAAMSRGEPGVPRRFRWRSQLLEVTQVLATWKSSTRDRGDLYLRRHWFEVLTSDQQRLTIYCERQARSSKKPKSRWWLYTIDSERAL